jgi:CheY-like chemotaxis protein
VAAGYRVLQAGDGEEALRIAEAYTEPIHLLLTDVVMPRLNGVEVAGRLTRQRPDTKVLYMSGFAVVGAQTEHLSGPGLQPGDPILPKPVPAGRRCDRHLRRQEVLNRARRFWYITAGAYLGTSGAPNPGHWAE